VWGTGRRAREANVTEGAVLGWTLHPRRRVGGGWVDVYSGESAR